MRVFVFFYLLFLLVSCNDPKCNQSDQYLLISKYISNFESWSPKEAALAGKPLEANLMLAELSGIASEVQYGDITVYASIKDYKSDLKRWKNWAEESSCDFTIQQILIKETEVLDNLNWIENN